MANVRDIKLEFIKALAWFRALSHRERIAVTIMLTSVVVVAGYLIIDETRSFLNGREKLIDTRIKHYEQLSKIVPRYVMLRKRLSEAQDTFAKSQLTFEEAFTELDKIVKSSTGSSDFDARKGQVTPVGLEFEKQEFTVQLKNVTLDKLTKLLFDLEQGERPLFLGKVDFSRTGLEGQFKATLEVFSIRKSSNNSTSSG